MRAEGNLKSTYFSKERNIKAVVYLQMKNKNGLHLHTFYESLCNKLNDLS